MEKVIRKNGNIEEWKQKTTENDESKSITKMFLNWLCYCKKSSQLNSDKEGCS